MKREMMLEGWLDLRTTEVNRTKPSLTEFAYEDGRQR